ncbi:type VII secretion protein EssC [Metabacillus malikii]|uniref:S-DNA-T family DNA segregation ATPase FtsK/SpoIIIE n=1 Tax=Metabacillus malikii TaxID=1504265 RepID=A0ABT9ZF20_9BACI|nr:type VII secretion protein EssC [Metabacillus malikii]MDQ0230843.1 S-DNA-T family DNA segregation ATPase FtsK/SpoIIIE [Metabacillus malikii]
MHILWVFYNQSYQQLSITLNQKQEVTIGHDLQHTITVRGLEKTVKIITEDNHYYMVDDNRKSVVIEEKQPYPIGTDLDAPFLVITPTLMAAKTYYIGHQLEVTFQIEESGGAFQKNVEAPFSQIQFTLHKESEGWKISTAEQESLFLNGSQFDGSANMMIGDCIFWPYMKITLLEEDFIQIESLIDYKTTLSETLKPQSEMQKKYPIYRRTPRMVYDLPDEDVRLSFPSQEQEPSNRSLWLIILPPLVMLLAMGLVAIFVPRGIYILITLIMFLTTIVTSTVHYFKDKGNQKRAKERRLRIYTNYLEMKRQELQALADKQKEVLTFHYPSFERMKYLTNQLSDRLWERTLESPDVLQFRLGLGSVDASYKISMSSSDLSNRETDHLLEESQRLERYYKKLSNLPVTANLSEGAIGLIGKDSVLKNELHQIIGQLAFFHSYHDLRFVFIFNEEEYKEWEWMKWLPHFQLPGSYAKGFIYNEKTRDQLLYSLYELIRERDLEEEKEKIRYSPQFVFVVTNHQLIADHVILEYLEGEHSHLGISVIFAAEAKESLSDNIHTLIRYINDEQGDILIQQKKAVKIPFTLDTHHRENNEPYARMLRTLDHQMGMTNSIPSSVSFLEMMNVKTIEQLPIKQFWLTKESAKSLAVPIGLKGKEDTVELNLHEKAHGPHGLLAGTTGSGKSEFLQTYILSLAVHFHPHEVAFLLIDYKGGGMAQPFKNMPHLLGTITNIEGSKNFSLRALASIKSELKQRQRLFDRYSVSHINDYTKLYKQGKAAKPLPHLFLISDEFAELKAEEPEFIKELVSAARIGRSLGVHLILATQKPGGVIDNQIWSNARFRVALKVQNVEDSREILKNGDAASITVTGRGYLQVGNNEVYELFQSAWSGAPYHEEDSYDLEDEVAIVTDLGLIPLSDVSASESIQKETRSEIGVIVEKIEQLEKEMKLERIPSPWLPPLPGRMFIDDVDEDGEKSNILLAMVDEPEKQSQSAYYYQMMDDGNVGIFGTAGFGKSHTVMTLLVGMAKKYKPEEVHFYIMDFGNGGLLPVKQLPHTADYFTIDQERKVEKFLTMLKSEIVKRKRLFQTAEVGSIKMYNALTTEKLPLLFLAIDNFDIIKEEMYELEQQINQMARDGVSLGIYMIISATRVNSVRQALMSNIKTKVVHYLMDSSEASSIVGRLQFSPESIPGRAIIKKDDAFFAQVFLPVKADNDFELIEKMKDTTQHLKAVYAESEKPAPIPMLPVELTITNFSEYVKEKSEQFPIGLDEEHVTPVYVNFNKTKHFIILGQAQRGKTNALKLFIHEAIEANIENIAIFDSIDRGLSTFNGAKEITYLEDKEKLSIWLDKVEEIIALRETEYQHQIQLRNHAPSFPPILFMIDGYSNFLQKIDNQMQTRIVQFMKNFSHLGFNVIVTGNNSELTKGYDALTVEIKQIRQALILVKKSEQTLYTMTYERKEPDVQTGFGYYLENGKEQRIQIPLVNIERKVHV